MYTNDEFETALGLFYDVLDNIREVEQTPEVRRLFPKTIYSLQQSIGAALDALPPGDSNRARKINGDLFERLIQLLLKRAGVDCEEGTLMLPIFEDGQSKPLFNMKYQHDLILRKDTKIKVIGSVKTTSKDRIDKVFTDKYIHNKIMEVDTPHIAIFLNDVQRSASKTKGQYKISSTFLTGRFKGYTIKLNPLDGVYYCDIRPNMLSDGVLRQHIKEIDVFFLEDVWRLTES